ncbi:MAG: response regulator transcription factor [Patescibacteria group bacterium]|nr:response regulator transcription factor [Patescibacteria group bacterium]
MRLLVVEDERKLNLGIKRGLEHEGYSVDSVFDGEQGEIFGEDPSYDLILLDVLLPKRNGIVVCRNLRLNKVTTPILVLTAKDTLEDKIFGLDSGADEDLMKESKFEELLARIRALLRRLPTSLPSRLVLEGLELDTITQTVSIDRKQIDITLKEFRLLEYLLRNVNRVVTREQILDHVWDLSFTSFANVVDVHIKNIRKKIGAKYASFLKTVRGIGYILKDHE